MKRVVASRVLSLQSQVRYRLTLHPDRQRSNPMRWVGAVKGVLPSIGRCTYLLITRLLWLVFVFITSVWIAMLIEKIALIRR